MNIVQARTSARPHRRHHLRQLAALAATLLLGTGCAQRTVIESVPTGAEVRVAGQLVGVTPLTMRLPAASWWGRATPVELRLPGYRTVSGRLDWVYDPRHWYLLLGVIPPFTPSQLLHLHPPLHRRPLGRYLVILEEDLGQGPDQRHILYGRDDETANPAPVVTTAQERSPGSSRRRK